MSWFDRLKQGLKKTRKNLIGRVESVIRSYKTIEPGLFDEIEELLVTADIGVNTAMEIIDRVKERIEEEDETDPGRVKDLLKDELKARLASAEEGLHLREDGLTVMLMMGVNGSGKTTTIAKIGQKFISEGKDVVFAASDTFRAAAIEQLELWAKRVGATPISHEIGADPSAVAYDALEYSVNNGADLLLIDTAGRLQTKHNLMEELKKINRVVAKKLDRPIDEKLLTIDATNGQNGVSQAEKFDEAIGLTGLIITKLDGTGKGGVIFQIVDEFSAPIKLIGVGESEKDLHQFDREEFVEALFR
ncbi:signal recognition particle-docking protein FtsY [Candidatus Bipolaricaulota bacterium]|nr:signal recognition particle-docking protein FtsY [Candidatus Bipolaricaulota bacterium]MBS3813789.1 signal recognition particle-docking protein FtsY [Candidatus Bipolaricaulota bacterium]MBS3825221.1 signal recognition particle-docking protein FtsY [Candidatus Bipolaricaulota bacterium]